MYARAGVHANPIQGSHLVLIVAVLAVLVTGCGGDADTAEEGAEPTAAVTEVETTQTAPTEPEVAVGGGERPDWLPVWLLLPPDLEITLEFQNGETGEAAVTGWISDGDLQKLYDDAWFMVQSGGYIIGEESADGDPKSFNADHTSDGSTVRFGVVGQNDGIVQWSMEFSGI